MLHLHGETHNSCHGYISILNCNPKRNRVHWGYTMWKQCIEWYWCDPLTACKFSIRSQLYGPNQKGGVVIEHAHNMACKWFEIMSGVLCVTSAAKGTYLARRLICSCLLVGYETFLLWAWKENDIGRKKDYYDMGGSTQAAIKVCLTVALASLLWKVNCHALSFDSFTLIQAGVWSLFPGQQNYISKSSFK